MNDNYNQDVDYSRRGPWDSPLPKYIHKKEIAVLVHDLTKDDGVVEQEFKLDYGNYEDRKFLGRLSFWAISNKRSIETMAIEEWEGIKQT